jgi:Fic family protein
MVPGRKAAGTEVPIVWRGRRARAFVPQLLADRDLGLSPQTVARTATAAAEVGVGAAALGPDYEALGRLLLGAEGVASSYIEGVGASIADVALAAAAESSDTPASWVAANLRAANDAVASAQRPLSRKRLCEWHRMLMTGSPLPGRYVGVLRKEQGWVGGTSPMDAALVTAPPDRLGGLVADLVSYANRNDIDPIAQAAIAHAQFEIVHPFADGNGRIGRVLVSWLLVRRLALLVPPPVSVRIAADRDGYLAGLTIFRLGDHEQWVRWFAEVVARASATETELVHNIERVQAVWRERLERRRGGRALRRDSLAWQTLDLLPRNLVLTASLAADELESTARAARSALRQLVEAQILAEHQASTRKARGRPIRLFVSPELLALVDS